MVRALQALRGMSLVAAATVIAELGDITRFANPRQLMASVSYTHLTLPTILRV